jgi:hypothetical protein
MLYYLLFLIYFVLLVYVIQKSALVRSSPFSATQIILLFALKATAGVLIGWMSATYYPEGNDYWTLHRDGLVEHQLLITDPGKFFTDIINSPYEDKYGGFFNSVGSYWNDLKNNIIIKILGLLNVLSGRNYYINSLFLNTLSFVGTIALANVFFSVSRNKSAVLIACFLLPSTLYFSSGIHKDLFVFSFLGFFIYSFYNLLKKFNIGLLGLFVISTMMLLLMRNIVLLIIFFPCIFLYLTQRLRWSIIKSAVTTFAFFIITFLLTHITPADPLKIVVQKQKDFFALGTAYSQLPLDTLQPSVKSFISITPEAANHSFLRPYLWEYPGHFLMLMAIELIVYLLLIAVAVLSRKWLTGDKSFYYFCIAFGFFMIITAGYIVPNTGSIVRYRSLYVPFLIFPALSLLLNRKKHIIF